MKASANYINTSNYFVTNTASQYFSGSYAYTIDTMKFYGAELEFNWKATEKLVVFGNYSYLKNEYDRDIDLPYAVLLELPPRNKGKLSIRYDLPSKMRLSSDLRFMGERKSEGGLTLDRYWVADVSLSKHFGNRMSVGFFADNLFGQDYQQVYGYPSPEQTFGIRLRVSSRPTKVGE